ncbi:putative transposase [Roseivivax marinus]|uniref:transposase n=1 Tax=Roseivivax marinus TaxID=1379903 RepID=UPI0008D6055B|nr:transposase [Roseivivax marinus]SEL91877.1 putative transposase [Roseivivax marinus]
MRPSKFSDAQKIAILQEAQDGEPVRNLCERIGISQATFYNWKKRLGNQDVSDIPPEVLRIRVLEQENARLRHLVADLSLEKEELAEIIKKNCIGLWSRKSNLTMAAQ